MKKSSKSYEKLKSLFNKIVNKKTLKLLFCVSCVLFLIFAPAFIFNPANYRVNLNDYLNLTQKDKIVLNMWHIETFEGGTNSRKTFIENQAKKYNKQNNNCFVSVKTLTEEQLFLNLQNGNTGDIYSFGIGAGYLIQDKLFELPKNNNVRKDLQEYSKIDNNIYAYPFILSGYALITNTTFNSSDNLLDLLQSKQINKKTIYGVGFANDSLINPSQVLIENGISNIKKDNYFTCSTTYNAYTNFLSKKFISLLGTARDVARLKNREQNGSISPCTYNFLGGYSDLIQYVGVSKNLTKEQTQVATDFSKFLTNETCQSSLKNYGLFSVTSQKIYPQDYMSDFEDELKNELKSVNIFSNLKDISLDIQKSFNTLFC